MRILITGANRGLGLSLSRAALESGHEVIAAVRNRVEEGSQLDRLQEAYSRSLHFVELDVAQENSIAAAARNVSEQFRYIDSIVNNAAILVERDKSIEELDLEQLRMSFEVNLFGAMMVVKHFLPLVKRSSAGLIINISSEAGSITNAYGGDYPYALSKAALNMFSQQLSRYLSADGVPVYSVHPGWMRTDMGGSQAPLDPDDSARAILELAARQKTPQTGKYVFVDYRGNEMPI